MCTCYRVRMPGSGGGRQLLPLYNTQTEFLLFAKPQDMTDKFKNAGYAANRRLYRKLKCARGTFVQVADNLLKVGCDGFPLFFHRIGACRNGTECGKCFCYSGSIRIVKARSNGKANAVLFDSIS